MKNIALLFLVFFITACAESTYNSENTDTQVESFITLISETPKDQRKQFFELYVAYLQPYQHPSGQTITPDLNKLHGMTAAQVMNELWEHYDMLDYMSQHGPE
jgi:hypothetical protein